MTATSRHRQAVKLDQGLHGRPSRVAAAVPALVVRAGDGGCQLEAQLEQVTRAIRDFLQR
ncbi:MAG: hypothetical protein WBF66_08880 [Dehalococcoidia bacterium]